MIRSARPRFQALKEDIYEIVEIFNTPETPTREATPLAFVTSTWNSPKLFAQVVVPLGDTKIESLGPKDYELKNVFLGKPTRDAS